MEIKQSPALTEEGSLKYTSLPSIHRIQFLAYATAIRNVLPSWVKSATVIPDSDGLTVKVQLSRSPKLESVVDLNQKLNELDIRVRLSIPELMPHRSLSPKIKQEKQFNVGEFKRYVDSTIPPDVTLRKFAHYECRLPGGVTNLIEIRGDFKDSRTIDDWRRNTEREHKVYLHLKDESEITRGLFAKLKDLSSRNDGLISDPFQLRRAMQKIQGWPPSHLPPERELPKGHLRDLTHLDSLITIDPQGSIDRDDAIAVEQVGPNSWKFYSAYADVSARIGFDSEHFRFARRGGRSIYGFGMWLPLLGEELSSNHLSLIPGETRRAWINEVTIDSDGKILNRDFYRANVKVSEAFTYEKCQQILDGEPHGQALNLRRLAWGSQVLRGFRTHKNRINRFAEGGEGSEIVQEYAIFAKESTAKFCNANKIPILYRVHGYPSAHTKRFIQAQLRRNGIDSTRKDFNVPERFNSLLNKISEEGHRKLGDSIIEAYIGRGYYQVLNDGHRGLSLPTYMPLSGLREFAAVVNQISIDAWFRGEKGSTNANLLQLGREANRKERSYIQRTHAFRMMERIHNILVGASTGEPALVTSIDNGITNVQINGFSYPIPLVIKDIAEVGTPIVLHGLAYDPYNEIFVASRYARAA